MGTSGRWRAWGARAGMTLWRCKSQEPSPQTRLVGQSGLCPGWEYIQGPPARTTSLGPRTPTLPGRSHPTSGGLPHLTLRTRELKWQKIELWPHVRGPCLKRKKIWKNFRTQNRPPVICTPTNRPTGLIWRSVFQHPSRVCAGAPPMGSLELDIWWWPRPVSWF